jgi:thymidylate synthase (FAD)
MQTKLKVKLIAHTPDADKVVAAAARLCYSAADVDTLMDGLTADKVEAMCQKLADLGHESPIEHASYTFAVEGVSRALLAQLTRHRIASYSVQSQRYVDKSDFDYIIPPSIAADTRLAEEYRATMHELALYYTDLVEQYNIPNEDARFVLPNACDTRIIFTMNARSLHNFFHLRCCNRAQWEIRELAWQMLELVRPLAPYVFVDAGPTCVRDGCHEGKMTCGKPYEKVVREK